MPDQLPAHEGAMSEESPNWIEVRNSIEDIFRELCRAVKQDTERYNGGFEFHDFESNIVVAKKTLAGDVFVRFALENGADKIDVTECGVGGSTEESPPVLTVRLVWLMESDRQQLVVTDAKGITTHIEEVWQISRHVLAPFFFGDAAALYAPGGSSYQR